MVRLIEIEGIGEVYAQKLRAAGIRGSGSFLECGASPKDRKELAERTGIDEGLILEWLNHVDLMRVHGIGGEYADLLEAAGVDTVADLARRSPDNLLKTLVAVNQEKKLVRRIPTRDQVAGWVARARELPKILTY